MIHRLLTWAALTAGLATGASIQFSLNVPAVTTGLVQGPAFTMNFTLPQFMPSSGATVLTNEPSLATSGWPNFSGALSANNNYLSIDFLANGSNFRGIFLSNPPTAHFDHTGIFNGDWQLSRIGSNAQGDFVTGTLTISDTPEPAASALAAAGLAAMAWVRLRGRTSQEGRPC